MEVDNQTKQLVEETWSSSGGTHPGTQSIVRVTLTDHTLFLTILGLILGVHLLHPSLIASILAFAPLPVLIHNDYRAFLSLGPGGTPSTFAGYLKITYLRLFALSDPFTPPTILDPRNILPAAGHLESSPARLARRDGPRPRVEGIAPQRQLDQRGCPDTHFAFRAAVSRLASEHPQFLRTGTSCFEKKGLALFAINPLNATCRGEICHVHHSDRSFHMNLHPNDAAVVLERGWGQRHPLARGGRFVKYVPKEFVMVYAPRNKEELEVVCRIVEAAAWWVCAQKFTLNVPKPGAVPE